MGKRGKVSARPPENEMAAMAATMTTQEISVALGVAQSTARGWLAEYDLTARTADRRNRPQNASELFKRFGDDVDQIKEYIESRTIVEIKADLGVADCAVYRWERKYGVRAKRVCTDCGKVIEFSEVAPRKDGRGTSRCQPCHDVCAGKPAPKKADTHVFDVPASIRWSSSVRMSWLEGINGWLRCHMPDLAA
jgi:transposase